MNIWSVCLTHDSTQCALHGQQTNQTYMTEVSLLSRDDAVDEKLRILPHRVRPHLPTKGQSHTAQSTAFEKPSFQWFIDFMLRTDSVNLLDHTSPYCNQESDHLCVNWCIIQTHWLLIHCVAQNCLLKCFKFRAFTSLQHNARMDKYVDVEDLRQTPKCSKANQLNPLT